MGHFAVIWAAIFGVLAAGIVAVPRGVIAAEPSDRRCGSGPTLASTAARIAARRGRESHLPRCTGTST